MRTDIENRGGILRQPSFDPIAVRTNDLVDYATVPLTLRAVTHCEAQSIDDVLLFV